MTKNTTPELQNLISAEPDLVDRIFEYLLTEVPGLAIQAEKLKHAVREEFKGDSYYIAGRPETVRQHQVAQVLALFNGRNATEVARRLGIGRATVYRILKQSAAPKNVPVFLEMRQPRG